MDIADDMTLLYERPALGVDRLVLIEVYHVVQHGAPGAFRGGNFATQIPKAFHVRLEFAFAPILIPFWGLYSIHAAAENRQLLQVGIPGQGGHDSEIDPV